MIFMELKNCPCCGGKARMHYANRSNGINIYSVYYVMCTKCGLSTRKIIVDRGEISYKDEKEAAELWNRRYSGIDDKNGKPICEGDHIRIVGKNWADGIAGEYEVCYSDVGFVWGLKRAIDDADYVCSRIISFSDLNIRHFTDEIELVHKEE